jgi:predicted transcriptional regulator
MILGDTLLTFKIVEKNRDFAEMLRNLDAECGNCAPITPLKCISRCNVWKLKNELRRLRETMNKPNFTKNLFNVLKNETRLNILVAIVNGRYSINQLQQKLKKAGRSCSRDTINEEYIRPLVDVGLAAEAGEQYYATMFGSKLTESIASFSDFMNILPAHSECHEETLLSAFLSGPKTFKEVRTYISPKIASRILKRLKTADLIKTPEERDYVFFFKTKRNPKKENLSSSERRVYENISKQGVSARKLADKAGISLRRTYKYLRGLKGKKLVFTRRTPKVYSLTDKGEKLAALLNELHILVEEIWNSSAQSVGDEKS